MKKVFAAIGVLVTAATVALVVPSVANAAPYCGIRWGSGDKSVAGTVNSPLTNVRAGRHDCFDRLVLDLSGRPNATTVRYVSQVTMDGSGQRVPLRGGAFIQIVTQGPAYDANGRPTYRFANRNELVNVSGYRTFRQVAWAGSFEGYTSVGLGVRGRLPMRAYALTNPSRIVIDVAHAW